MALLEKQPEMDARSLQALINEKQAEVGAKLSSLKGDLTLNPISDIAGSKPVLMVGAAIVAGLLAAAVWRGLGSRQIRKRDEDKIVKAVAQSLQERVGDTRAIPSSEEIAAAVRKIDLVHASAAGRTHSSGIGSFIGSFLASIARSVAQEVLGSVLSSITARAQDGRD